MAKKSRQPDVTPTATAESLEERARSVVTQVEAASLLLSSRAAEWNDTLRELYARSHGLAHEPGEAVVELSALELYRTTFDAMAALAMMMDPYALNLGLTDGPEA